MGIHSEVLYEISVSKDKDNVNLLKSFIKQCIIDGFSDNFVFRNMGVHDGKNFVRIIFYDDFIKYHGIEEELIILNKQIDQFNEIQEEDIIKYELIEVCSEFMEPDTSISNKEYTEFSIMVGISHDIEDFDDYISINEWIKSN